MPGLAIENQERWVKDIDPRGTLLTHLIAPKEWECDMMGFLTNTFLCIRLPDLLFLKPQPFLTLQIDHWLD